MAALLLVRRDEDCGAAGALGGGERPPAEALVREQVTRSRAGFQQVTGDVALADGGQDDGPGPDDAAAQVRLGGEAEAVEPLGVGGVAAEPGGQVIARAGPLVRAADPGRVLHRQRAGVHLLAVVFREPGRESGPGPARTRPAASGCGGWPRSGTAAAGTGGTSPDERARLRRKHGTGGNR
jgi:hypothetical protein